MICWSGTQASSDYAQGVIQDTVDEVSLSAATPDWCAVFSCGVDRDKATVRSVLAPAPHPEPTSHLSNVRCKDSFLHEATRW